MGVVGIATIARLDQADIVVTDSGLDGEALGILRNSVPEVVVVDAADDTAEAADAVAAADDGIPAMGVSVRAN